MSKVVVIAIRHPTEPNLFLHGLRRDNKKWALAGGHAKLDEDDSSAAQRELREETGLDNVKLDKAHEKTYGDINVHLFTGDCPQDLCLDPHDDPDKEFVTFKFLDPRSHQNLHVPAERNILSEWMSSSMAKSELTADQETEIINENKKKPAAQVQHKFKPAKWTHPNGHPRCIICGDEERTGGMCEPVTKAGGKIKVEPFVVEPSAFNPKKHDFIVRYILRGKQAGILAVTHKPDGLMPFNFEVKKQFRRKGFGTAMAEHAQKISGKKIVRSPDMTQDAHGWANKFIGPANLKKSAPKTVFVAMDGDNIGASVERAAMADDLETIRNQSKLIHDGQRLIRRWAEKNGAEIYIDGGDDVAFILDESLVPKLEALKDMYNKVTGYTVTVGVGDTISHAGHAMLYGKLHGKNQINRWTQDIQDTLDSMSREISPQEKLRQEGLLKIDQPPQAPFDPMKNTILLYPVTIGQKSINRFGLPFHMTIKSFGQGVEPHHDAIRQVVDRHGFNTPVDESKMMFVPHKLRGLNGKTHYALLVYGMHPRTDRLRAETDQFGPKFRHFLPHISIEKEDWNRFSKMGSALTAQQAGIKIHPAELRYGNTVLKTY